MSQDPIGPSGEGGIPLSAIAVPSQHLERSETRPFLDDLFGDLAHRPERLQLRETAAVTRYLRMLYFQGIPVRIAKRGQKAIDEYKRNQPADHRKRAWHAENTAKILWGELRNHGKIKPSGKEQAIRFLQKHSIYFPFYAKQTLDFVMNFDLPPGSKYPIHPPRLRSGSMTVGGDSNRRLKDDLSERISAGFYALRRASVPRAKQRIAYALVRAQIKPDPKRSSGRTDWTDENVNDRIKQYERKLRKEIRKIVESDHLDRSHEREEELLTQRRAQLADTCISRWRWKLEVDRSQRATTAEATERGAEVPADQSSNV
jgi:hypothetical protein